MFAFNFNGMLTEACISMVLDLLTRTHIFQDLN